LYMAQGSLANVFLRGVPGASELADTFARTPPTTCEHGIWTLGEVHASFERVQVCCQRGSPAFLRRPDGDGWFADDTIAVSAALRARSELFCAGSKPFDVAYDEANLPVNCGREKHMYTHTDFTGVRKVDRDAECATRRHVAAYGELGLAGRPSESARGMGHLAVLGKQGQRLRPVIEVNGCAPQLMWEHAFRNLPLVLRGCVNDSSPITREWTPSYLREHAPQHRARFCPEALGDYLDRMNRSQEATDAFTYRNCGQIPTSLLKDLAVPYPLRFEPYTRGFDKTVLWYGRSGASPLHYDPNHNFMHQIDGQKRILLIDPADSVLIYADHTDKAVGNTPLDPFKVDLDAYPYARQVALSPVVLDPGDLLFIPTQWWHMVLSIPNHGNCVPIEGHPGAHCPEPVLVRNMALTVQFDRGSLPYSTGSHFSHRRAELHLNLPKEVPSVEEMAVAARAAGVPTRPGAGGPRWMHELTPTDAHEALPSV
jgi:hypothetical protein